MSDVFCLLLRGLQQEPFVRLLRPGGERERNRLVESSSRKGSGKSFSLSVAFGPLGRRERLNAALAASLKEHFF